MQTIKNKIDFLATALSFMCLVQCLVFPLLAIFGVVFFDLFSHDVEHLVIAASIVLSLLMTYHTYMIHSIKIPLIVAIVGLLIFVINEIMVDKHYMHIVVSFIVGGSHVMNYIIQKNKCKHPHNCKK